MDGYIALWSPSGQICLSGQPIVRGHDALRAWMGGFMVQLPAGLQCLWVMMYHVDPAAVNDPQLVVASGKQTIRDGDRHRMRTFLNVTFVKEGGQWKMLTVAGIDLAEEQEGKRV